MMNNEWGAALTKFRRVSAPIILGRSSLPNARSVSNIICRTNLEKKNARGLSEFATFTGQFLDHTITETENTQQNDDIRIPSNDPVFTNGGTIPFFKTKKEGFGVFRISVNRLPSFIDASSVYGPSEAEAKALRSLVEGKLKMGANNFLPKNARGFFLAGDTRVNENPLLTSLHTLWAREHNRIADEILVVYPALDDEAVYQLARSILICEMQAVIFYEFVPSILGKHLKDYTGYKTWVRPEITDEFSTVGFRVGHTLVNAHVTSITSNGSVHNKRFLRNSFFNPRAFAEDGMDNLIRGMLTTPAGEVDNEITDEVRNFLVSDNPKEAMQLDLAALNIQRGRDHSIPTYNALRMAYGLRPLYSFADITQNEGVQVKLRQVYGQVAQIDAWVGGICEDHLPKSSLGPLFAAIWEDQFTKLRDGDRFYFEQEDIFTLEQKVRIPTLKYLTDNKGGLGNVMKRIILKNTAIKENEISASPFFVI